MIETNLFSKGRPLVEYLKKQKENKKFLKTVETSGTFFLVTFFLLFAIRPTALTISALVGEIKVKEKMVADMRNKIGDLVLAQDAFSRVQERYNVINSALPDSPDYRQSMVQIISAGNDSGVPIDKLNYNLDDQAQKSSTQTNLGSFSVAISRKTSFALALDLIDKMLHNRRLISLKSIKISSDKKEKTPSDSPSLGNQIDVAFINEIFFWKPQNGKK